MVNKKIKKIDIAKNKKTYYFLDVLPLCANKKSKSGEEINVLRSSLICNSFDFVLDNNTAVVKKSIIAMHSAIMECKKQEKSISLERYRSLCNLINMTDEKEQNDCLKQLNDWCYVKSYENFIYISPSACSKHIEKALKECAPIVKVKNRK